MPEQVSFHYDKVDISGGKDSARDGFMFAERQMPEKEYVLTAIEHPATDAGVYAKPVTFTAQVSFDHFDAHDGFALV